jgi:hypothetical protein
MFNPRRANFPISDPNAAEEQIRWEHSHLWAANVVSMWFSSGISVQPICMFEWGVHLTRYRLQEDRDNFRVVIGIKPEYTREQDVRIQTDLVNESCRLKLEDRIQICSSLEELAQRAKAELTKVHS